MLIYDSTSIAFTKKAEAMVKEILLKAGIPVHRSRFEMKGRYYPINIVTFEGPNLGHYVSLFYQMGLNRKLIYCAKDSVVRDILKHELAHYLTHIIYGEVQAHGVEFRKLCADFGFPADIAAATMDVEESNLSKQGDLHSERILTKVKKLLELSRSANTHEAQMATLKANELLLRHNIEYIKDDQGPVYLNRVMIKSRKDAKMTAVYQILSHFMVKAVFSHGVKTCCLEISGSHTNVTLATYIAEYLDRELEELWISAKKEHNLSGPRARNSFLHGVAEGFDQKMKKSKESFSAEDKKSLLVVEQKLLHNTEHIYKSLRNIQSHYKGDATANDLGIRKGHKLTIRSAVEGKAKNLYLTDSSR